MTHLSILDPKVAAAIRTLRACEHAYSVVATMPVRYPYAKGSIPAATKRRKLAKLAKDQAMTLALLLPA